MKPLVYIAGPITIPEPMANVHDALRAADQFLDAGVIVPFVPHLTALWQIVTPRDYETWLAYDFAVIEHCQALYRLDGESSGADREVEYARELGLPVFPADGRMNTWALEWAHERRPYSDVLT